MRSADIHHHRDEPDRFHGRMEYIQGHAVGWVYLWCSCGRYGQSLPLAYDELDNLTTPKWPTP